MDWKWGSVEEGRLKRAASVKFIAVDMGEATAICKGSGDHVYTTSLSDCSCADFAINQGQQACKHIIRLGIECGCINKNGYTLEGQKVADYRALKNKIALCAGWYHVFGTAIISDAEYDLLKAEYQAAADSMEPLLDKQL